MDKREVEGVLGHEIAHVANGDMVTMTLLQGVINAFVIFFSRLVASAIAGGRDSRRGTNPIEFILIIVLQIVFGLLGNVAIAFFSRGREFRADAGGARYAGREKMISALEALGRKIQSPQHPVEDKFASFKISSQKAGGFWALMRTHPSLEDRIARLRQTPISR
jgi:heat shock protein HtpX